MMKQAIGILLAGLLLAGCGGTDSTFTSGTHPNPATTGDNRVWPGGKKLAEYKGLDSYQWRVNVLDHEKALLKTMREISPELEEGDLNAVLDTCQAISDGLSRDQLMRDTSLRFSKSDPINGAQATRLIAASRTYACPD